MNYLEITRFPALDYSCNEAMNTLCTNLSYCGTDVRTILVTSRYAQEGKSSISINMMRTLAGFGKKVLLLDADLRASGLARRYRFSFGGEESVGLSQYLADMCELNDVIYQTNLSGAYVLPVGRTVLNSMQLLSSPRFGEMMKAVKERFDVIIVDTSPAGVIVDAVEIAKYCDGALLVVGYNKGRKQDVGALADNIAMTGCKVLGAVMNGVEFKSVSNRKYYYRSKYYSAYYYYYGHGYGYGYGYGQNSERSDKDAKTGKNAQSGRKARK